MATYAGCGQPWGLAQAACRIQDGHEALFERQQMRIIHVAGRTVRQVAGEDCLTVEASGAEIVRDVLAGSGVDSMDHHLELDSVLVIGGDLEWIVTGHAVFRRVAGLAMEIEVAVAGFALLHRDDSSSLCHRRAIH